MQPAGSDARADAPPSTWVITEQRDTAFAGRDGREIHGEAIARAMGAEPLLLRIPRPSLLSLPWHAASFDNSLDAAVSAASNAASLPPWPQLILAIGRVGLRCGRRLRTRSGGRSFLAVLQKPSLPFHGADFVWAPAHDRLSGKNTFSTLFSPHPFTPQSLRAAADCFAPVFEKLPATRIGVLIGGPSAAYRFDREDMERLCAALRKLAQSGSGLIVATSRRSGEARHRHLQQCLDGLPAILWDRRDSDFYPALLGAADVFVATPDSVNMIGEAASTGKGILLFPMHARSVRFRRFHAEIARRGITRPLGEQVQFWNYAPINATDEIAASLRAAMLAKRQTTGQ